MTAATSSTTAADHNPWGKRNSDKGNDDAIKRDITARLGLSTGRPAV